MFGYSTCEIYLLREVREVINKQSIINLPIALAGIALGFSSISSVWESLGGTYIRHFAIFFSLICIGLLIVKFLLDPKKQLVS